MPLFCEIKYLLIKKYNMNFLANYDSDDDDEEEIAPVKKVVHLPSADEVLKAASKSSVFANKYDSEEKEKAVLEKHVKMVENKQNISEVNGKKFLDYPDEPIVAKQFVGKEKVCWMFRRDGRCRFGKRCKMFHDSDLREASLREGKELFVAHSQTNADCDATPQDEELGDRPPLAKKKRYGVTDTLQPPKKAMKIIKRLQDNENLNRRK